MSFGTIWVLSQLEFCQTLRFIKFGYSKNCVLSSWECCHNFGFVTIYVVTICVSHNLNFFNFEFFLHFKLSPSFKIGILFFSLVSILIVIILFLFFFFFYHWNMSILYILWVTTIWFTNHCLPSQQAKWRLSFSHSSCFDE